MSEIGAVSQARAAVARGDYDVIINLLATRPLEFWFGLVPSELREILEAVPPETLQRNPGALLILRFFSAAPIDEQVMSDYQTTDAVAPDESLRQWFIFAQAAQARLRGDPETSYELMVALPAIADTAQQLIDSTRGQRTFMLVQAAMSAMLAGRVSEAIRLYERAIIATPPSGLMFFTREAHTRTALLHGLFGDRELAKVHLVHAAAVPRTESWVEPLIDSDEQLVRAVLMARDAPAEAFALVNGLSLQQVGEMWPFWVSVFVVTGFRSDRRAEVRDRLVSLGASMSGPSGRGFAASVIPAALAFDALASGHVPRARKLLGTADGELWLIRLLSAVYEITAGSPRRGLQIARNVRTESRGMRQIEEWRLAIIALAHLSAGAEADATKALEEYLSRPGSDVVFVAMLSAQLFEFAASEVPGWPERESLAGAAGWGIAGTGAQLHALTERELDVLDGLARGETREQMAQSLFLSVNTVKTHQRSLYRKLGATSASEALLIGERLGLV